MNVKRCLSIFVVLCMLLSSLAVFTLTATAEAIYVTDTTTKVVSVYNKATETTEELTLGAFMTAAASSDFSGKELTLLENISLAGVSQSIPNFAGVLNGNHKTVSDLSVPLFATLTGATVKDLTLAGSIESTATTVGALANTTTATAEEGGVVTVQNCVNNVAVKGTCSTATFYVAGFIGQANDDLTFISCVNNGNVSSESAKGTSMGGFVGQTKADASIKLNLTACINNGAITAATGNQQALNGGLVGESKCTLALDQCLNKGAVSSTSDDAGAGHKMGGLIGIASTAKLTITSCGNYGDVSSNRSAGGIVGQCDSAMQISNSINAGDIVAGVAEKRTSPKFSNSYAGGFVAYIAASQTFSFTSCVNYGAISTIGVAGLTDIKAGGFVGYHGKATTTLNNCANYGNVSASTTSGVNNATRVGGAIGHIQSDTTSITNTGFYNAGSVTTDAGHAGGIYGWSDKAAALKLENCYVSGKVTAAEGKTAGAYGGDMKQALDIVNCGFADGVVATDYLYYENGMTSAQAKAGTPTSVISFKGYQQKLVSSTNDALGVRFVAGLDSLEYKSVGFEVYAVQSGVAPKLLNKSVTTVYESLYAYSADGALQDTVTAESLNCEFLTTIVLTDLPTESDVTLIVVPYVTDANNHVTYGLSATVQVIDGQISY